MAWWGYLVIFAGLCVVRFVWACVEDGIWLRWQPPAAWLEDQIIPMLAAAFQNAVFVGCAMLVVWALGYPLFI